MSRMVPVYMEGRALVPEFALGPLRFVNAERLSLDEMYCNIEDDEITLRLSSSCGPDSPWRGAAMVVFFLYRFPPGAEEFEEELARYRKDEAADVVLPEGKAFEDSVFALSDVDGQWKQDSFAVSKRNLFQVYRSGDCGVMIRWFSQTGTMLDHPLLSLVRDNVSLVAGQWATEAPATVQVESGDAADVDEDEEFDEEFDDEFDFVTELDLRVEKQRVRQFIENRIQAYADRNNFGPGEPGDPIRLMTLGFYAEQTGYVALVFDTRPDADCDGNWTLFIEDELNTLLVPEWYGCYMAVCEEETVTITTHDGVERVIENNEIDDEELNELFGDMLASLMRELRDEGVLAKLPLHQDAFYVLEEFDGRFGWPDYETRQTDGRIGKS